MFSKVLLNLISYAGGFGSVIKVSKIFKIDEVETQEWEGVCTMRWIAGRDDAKNFRFVHYKYEPNWSTNKTHLHHARESAYYILEGSARVSINGKEHVIGPSSAVYLKPGDIHGVVGAGPKGLVMLEVWAPVEPDIVYYEDGKKIKD